MKKISLRKTAKEVMGDPGVGFNACDTILYASVSPIGFWSCLVALGVSVAAKGTSMRAAQKPSRLRKFLGDYRTTLLSNSAALSVMGVASLLIGEPIPAAAGFLFAFGNWRIADSLAKAEREQKDPVYAALQEKKRQGLSRSKKLISLVFERPDLYIHSGAAVASLLSGMEAIFAAPVIGGAFLISLRNVWQGKPEHAGYPKVLAAAAAWVAAGVGIAHGNWLPALSGGLVGAVLINIETKITPGGGKQILRDIKGSMQKLFGRKHKGAAPANNPIPPVHPPSDDNGAEALTNKELSGSFKVSSDKDNAALKDKPRPPDNKGPSHNQAPV